MHINFLRSKITINLVRKAQIALLLAKKVTVPAKYLNIANVFLEESENVFLKQTGVNEYAIKIEKDKQPLYEPIYSLKPVELKIFKTYIKINLANSFIYVLKSPVGALILFERKLNGSFDLCVNY